MANVAIPFEWFFETLNKRLAQGIKIEDLFLCVPTIPEVGEAELDFELSTQFKYKSRSNLAVGQGNDLDQDYPVLAKLIRESNKVINFKVFLIDITRLRNPVILHTKKYKYPKINKVKATKRILTIH